MAGAEATDNEENDDNLRENTRCHTPLGPTIGAKPRGWSGRQTDRSMGLICTENTMVAVVCPSTAPVKADPKTVRQSEISAYDSKECSTGFVMDQEEMGLEANAQLQSDETFSVHSEGRTTLYGPGLAVDDTAKGRGGKSKKRLKRTLKEKLKEKQTKTKKWRALSLEEVGIYPSLFPRLPSDFEQYSMDIDGLCDREFDDIEQKIVKSTDFELYCAFGVKEFRSDRDKKIRKARIQVKDKYCVSVKNNNGKRLYVHHRVFKLMDLEPQKAHYLPQPKTTAAYSEDVKMSRAKLKAVGGNRDRVKGRKDNADKPTPPAAAQTRHALHSSNVPPVIASDQGLVDLLISMQHRELSPEDYELLLRLDEQVAPKTVSEQTLSSFKTDEVSEDHTADACTICMENYSVGQQRKYLPCEHIFHAGCIDMWLQNSSPNCPLDGLPVSQ